MTTDKTLADAKPGGCVQLPTPERGRFEACAHAQSYRGGNILTDRDADHPELYADPLAQLAWKIWQAALSAQPSPGGQDAARYERLFLSAVEMLTKISLRLGLEPNSDGVEPMLAAIDALAARQPVATMPEWFELVIRDVCELDPEEPDAADTVCIRLLDLRLIMERHAPPAQAVDLGALRRLSDGWLARSEKLSVTQQRKAGAFWACAKELRDWLDSQAVGNG